MNLSLMIKKNKCTGYYSNHVLFTQKYISLHRIQVCSYFKAFLIHAVSLKKLMYYISACSLIQKAKLVHIQIISAVQNFFDDIRNTCNCNPWTLSLMTLLSTFLTKLISPLVKFSKTGFDPIVNLENLLKWIRKISSRNKVEIILWI